MFNIEKVEEGDIQPLECFTSQPKIPKGKRLVAVLSSPHGGKQAYDVTEEKVFMDLAIYCSMNAGVRYTAYILSEEDFGRCTIRP